MELSFKVDIKVTEGGGKKATTPYSLESDLNGEWTMEQLVQHLKTSLIQISLDVLAEEQARGFDKDPVMVVDGKTKPLFSVSPFGRIEFFSRIKEIAPVLEKIYSDILKKSPVDTATYIEGNLVLVNGKTVATNMVEFQNYLKTAEFSATDIIRFINVTPYARKLERSGITAQRRARRLVKSRDKKSRGQIFDGNKILAPNGVYYLTLKSFQKKYKFLASAKFKLVPGGSFDTSKLPTTANNGKPLRRTYKKTGEPYLYPSIVINFKEAGIA